MEKIITISFTEKICVVSLLASFIGCLALTLYLNVNPTSLTFWSVESADQELSRPYDHHLNKTTTSLEDSHAEILNGRNRRVGQFNTVRTASLQLQQGLLNEDIKEGFIDDAVSMDTDHQASQGKQQLNFKSNSSEGGTSTLTVKHQGCNMMDGSWVYDNLKKASPMYHVWQCPFLSDQVSCQRNGRSDFEYEKWSWEAKGCQIPQFNGTDMLERLRGKRVVIAGDSLNRNQWESLSCMLYSSIPASRAHVDYKSSVYKVFIAKDYNCSVEFFWAPFLIQLDVQKETGSRILRLNRLINSAKLWKGSDIMVFNTGHWWVHSGKSRAWDFLEHKGKLLPDMSTYSALETAMKTWARWIDKNVDINKTKVYFRSISPEHKGRQQCYNQTEPIRSESFEYNFPREILEVIAKTVSEMKTQRVRYLNITKLSEYRKDAHPSVYARKKGDCSHWCLPGVPDTWNRLIYADMVTGYLNTSLGSAS